MKKNGLLICGVCLLVCAIGIFSYMQITQNRANQQAKMYIEQLKQSMPEVTDSFVEERNDSNMSMMEIDGENFVGILEVPAYGTELPVGSSWQKGKTAEYPCRYWGSVFDNNLIIGGSDYPGQFDFMEKISMGDTVYITDVTGARVSYTVSWIEKTEEVSKEYLENKNEGLTLFSRSPYGFDYTVVRCK